MATDDPAPAGLTTEPDEATTLALVSEQLRTQAGWDEAIVTGVDWVSTFRVHRRLATSYRRRRVPLAGDAAHIHAPFGGQGMNTGIGDAENLAWKLALVAGGLAGTALLDTYEAERRPIATDVLSSTSSLTEMRFGDGAVARALRDHVVLPLLDRPRVQRSIAEKSSQLGVSYRGGPLARRRWTLAGALGRRVEPGDRVADRTCRRSDGTTTRLNAELGPGWVLLTAAGIAAPECAAVAAGRLGDDRVIHLRSDDERSGDVLLVRPDGHLAWRGTDPASLGQWLGEALRGGDERTPMASSAASRGKRPTADARG